MADVSNIDWCSRWGAGELADRLHAYWLERGVDARVWIEEAWLWKERSVYGVRSSLKLELPRADSPEMKTNGQ
jgi:hypothetical protein